MNPLELICEVFWPRSTPIGQIRARANACEDSGCATRISSTILNHLEDDPASNIGACRFSLELWQVPSLVMLDFHHARFLREA